MLPGSVSSSVSAWSSSHDKQKTEESRNIDDLARFDDRDEDAFVGTDCSFAIDLVDSAFDGNFDAAAAVFLIA